MKPAYALDVSGDVTSGVYRVNGVPMGDGSSRRRGRATLTRRGRNLTGVGKLAIIYAQWLVTVASPKTSGSNSLQAWMSSDSHCIEFPLTLALSLTGAATAAGRSANLQVTEW